jgi:hypothetical protein
MVIERCGGVVVVNPHELDNLSSCRPQGVIHEQAVRVVVAYIERRPQRMHEDFRRLALEAMHEASWPANPRGSALGVSGEELLKRLQH